MVLSFLLLGLFYVNGQAQQLWDDFETNRFTTYKRYTGVMIQSATNPSAGGMNTSAKVMQYTRNAGSTYDAITAGITGSMLNADLFKNGSKKLSMKVYSSAVGTPVTLSLEDTNATTATNYPIGRHSQYTCTTTVANQWEQLTFNWNSTPMAGMNQNEVTAIVIMIKPNSNTNVMLYLDDLMFTEFNGTTPAPVPPAQLLQNYEDVNLLQFVRADGTITNNVPNPGANAVNPTSTCAKYDRNTGNMYDAWTYNLPVAFRADEIALLKGSRRKFKMKVYSLQPNIKIDITLINPAMEAAAGGAWPAGRHTIYEARTTKQNTWEDVVFDFHEAPDPAVPDSSVTQFIVQLNSQSNAAATIWFDEISGPHLKGVLALPAIQRLPELSVFPNPVTDFLNIGYVSAADYSFAELVTLQGQTIKQFKLPVACQGNFKLSVTDCAPGVYLLKVQSSGGNLQKRVVIN